MALLMISSCLSGSQVRSAGNGIAFVGLWKFREVTTGFLPRTFFYSENFSPPRKHY